MKPSKDKINELATSECGVGLDKALYDTGVYDIRVSQSLDNIKNKLNELVEKVNDHEERFQDAADEFEKFYEALDKLEGRAFVVSGSEEVVQYPIHTDNIFKKYMDKLESQPEDSKVEKLEGVRIEGDSDKALYTAGEDSSDKSQPEECKHGRTYLYTDGRAAVCADCGMRQKDFMKSQPEEHQHDWSGNSFPLLCKKCSEPLRAAIVSSEDPSQPEEHKHEWQNHRVNELGHTLIYCCELCGEKKGREDKHTRCEDPSPKKEQCEHTTYCDNCQMPVRISTSKGEAVGEVK